jgi:hypothetical protein
MAEPKTKYSRRRIALSQQAIVALQRDRVRLLESRLAAGSVWDESSDLVFPDAVRKSLYPVVVSSRYFRRVLHKHHLPMIRFHDCHLSDIKVA